MSKRPHEEEEEEETAPAAGLLEALVPDMVDEVLGQLVPLDQQTFFAVLQCSRAMNAHMTRVLRRRYERVYALVSQTLSAFTWTQPLPASLFAALNEMRLGDRPRRSWLLHSWCVKRNFHKGKEYHSLLELWPGIRWSQTLEQAIWTVSGKHARYNEPFCTTLAEIHAAWRQFTETNDMIRDWKGIHPDECLVFVFLRHLYDAPDPWELLHVAKHLFDVLDVESPFQLYVLAFFPQWFAYYTTPGGPELATWLAAQRDAVLARPDQVRGPLLDLCRRFGVPLDV